MQRSPLEQLRALHDGPARGASEAEVVALERALGTRLPADYRAFLLWMGRDTEGMWQGTDCFIDDIVENTEGLPELLALHGLAGELAERYVCVLMHQGYIALWFDVPTDSDDPQAFLFHEGQTERGIQPVQTVMKMFLDDYEGLSRV